MKYKLNTKKMLLQANWKHEDFGTVAKFLGWDWYVDDSMLEEINIVDRKLPNE